MLKIYVSDSHNPYLNVATENYLLQKANVDDILYLWINDPCVVIGRNQNVYSECNLEFMNEVGILPVRRFSGGGAVYQDLGNVNYTFITNKEDDTRLKEILFATFNKLNIPIKFSGRNDILVDDKKISGLAYLEDFNHFMYHGTMLIKVDFERLVKSITPKKIKLEGHNVKSVSSRVINLTSLKEDLTNELFIKTIISSASSFYSEVKKEELVLNSKILKIKDKLENKDFIYNDTPKFNVTMDIKNESGLYTFNLEVEDGKIVHITSFTDSLELNKLENINKSLENTSFSYLEVEKYLKSVL